MVSLLDLVAKADLKTRLILFVRIFYHKPDLARDLIDLLFDRLAFLQVLEFHGSRYLGEDRERERIPRGKHVVLFDLLAILDVKLRAVNDLIACDLASALVHEAEFRRLTFHRDHFTFTVLDHLPIVNELNGPVHRSGVFRLLLETCGTADVEGSHRQLGSRFADRLGSDNTYRLTDLDRLAGRKVASVTFDADAAAAFASESRADADLRKAR